MHEYEFACVSGTLGVLQHPYKCTRPPLHGVSSSTVFSNPGLGDPKIVHVFATGEKRGLSHKMWERAKTWTVSGALRTGLGNTALAHLP